MSNLDSGAVVGAAGAARPGVAEARPQRVVSAEKDETEQSWRRPAAAGATRLVFVPSERPNNDDHAIQAACFASQPAVSVKPALIRSN